METLEERVKKIEIKVGLDSETEWNRIKRNREFGHPDNADLLYYRKEKNTPLGVINPQDRTSLLNLMDKNILDLVFDNIFIYSTMFESLNGYSKSGTGTVTLDSTGINFLTAATANSFSSIIKEPATVFLTFNKESRFKATVDFISLSNLTSASVFITIGSQGIGENYYGFETNGTALRASSSNPNTTTSNSISLQTTLDGTQYELEARFYKTKTDFYVNQVLKGTLASEQPKGVFSILPYLYIKTGNGSAKTMNVNEFTYMQSRL